MSVGFFVPGGSGAKRLYQCICVRRMSDTPHVTCSECKGTGIVALNDDGGFNMTASNWISFSGYMQMLGVEFPSEEGSDYPCGQIAVETLPKVYDQLAEARPKVPEFDEYTRRRIGDFQDLCLQGLYYKQPLCWG